MGIVFGDWELMKMNVASLCFGSLLCAACVNSVLANPVGGSVVGGSGNATIAGQGTSLTTINQTANQVIINWQDFSIGSGEITRFVQPSATASALNRILSGNPSLIYGSLQANGRVFVINPNGILVGPGGQVDTKGFIASTLDIPDASFLSGGNLIFSGTSTAGIKNQGSINALGGDVFLIAHTVENDGTIRAPQGTVGLAAGSQVQLVQSGSEHLSVLAGNSSAPIAAVGVNNAGNIQATSAELKAAGGNIYALAINNDGVVRATGIVNKNGRIYLRAAGGNIQNAGTLSAQNADGSGGTIVVDGGHNATTPATVIISGTIDASGRLSGTKGGTVEMLGDNVGLFDGALVDASGDAGGGKILIGGGYHGANPTIQNAEATFVGPDAQIVADSITRGNGGNVVVWSDGSTRFYGEVSSRGGAVGGNGGLVEISGHYLDFLGTVCTLAPHGPSGMLLLDPTDLTINNGPDQNINASTPFIPNASPSHLSWATIDTALGLSAVTVTTVGSPANAQPGNITIATASPVLNRNNKLTLDAAGGITINSGSTIVNNGTGDLELDAAGAVTIGAAITLGGNLGVTAAGLVNFTGAGASTVGGTMGITTTAGGINQTGGGTLKVTGISTLAASGAGNDIILGNNNDFSTVVVTSGNNVTLKDINAINLGNLTVGGNLGVTAAGLVDFTGAGNSTVDGTMGITTTVGGIGQTGAGTLTVTGTSTLAASGAGNDITLNNNNDFSTVSVTSGHNVTLVDANAIAMGASTVSGTLHVTANGSISESGALSVSAGASTFTIDTATADVLLGTQANHFGGQTVTFNSINGGIVRDVSFRNADAAAIFPTIPAGLRNLTLQFDAAGINLPTLNLTGNLGVTAGGLVDFAGAGASTMGGTMAISTTAGGITDSGSGTLTVTGTTTLSAGSGNDITLNNNNDFNTVVITSGRNVTLNDVNAISLGNLAVSGNLSVTAAGLVDFAGAGASTVGGTLGITTTAGGITDSGSGTLTVTGTSTLAAGVANDITLDNNNNFSTVAITSGRNVTLDDVNAISLGNLAVSGNLGVTAAGLVDFAGAGASTVGGTLGITTTSGGITDSGSGTVTVTGTSALAAGAANDITLNNNNDFSTVSVTSGHNVTLVDANAIALGASTVSGGLHVTAHGNITESAPLNAASGSSSFTIDTATADVLLGTEANHFGGQSVTINAINVGSVRDVSFRNADAGALFPTVPSGLRNLTVQFDTTGINLPTLTVSGTLSISSDGAVTQSGNLTANALQVTAAGPVILGPDTTATSVLWPWLNRVNTVSGSVTGTGNAFSFIDQTTPLPSGLTVAGISTVNGNVALTADVMMISGAINTAGNLATVLLQPFTANRTITMGTKIPNAFSLTQNELNEVTSKILQIGNTLVANILGKTSVTTPLDVLQLVFVDTQTTTLASSSQLAGLLAGAILPAPKVQVASFSGAVIDVEAAAKILPPGSIGVLFLQVPFPPGHQELYKIEDVSKWTAGRITAAGTSVPQSAK